MESAVHPVDQLPIVWDPDARIGDMLKGKRGLVVGIANEHSIAYGCADKLRAFGADLAVTYLNEKARGYVEPLAERMAADLLLPLDVQQPGQLDAVFEAIRAKWGRLDFLIHAIAFAPRDDLHGRVVDCSREGFLLAMAISCYSFIEMARLAEPLMTQGGALINLSYYGSEKVVGTYNMMGPVKAALESATRYVAAELAQKEIRVYSVSPGPVKTRAASGIAAFDAMIASAKERAPGRRLVEIDEVGRIVSFLVSGGAKGMTGNTIFIDHGLHVIG